MRILLTGATGQLGQAFLPLARTAGHAVTPTSRRDRADGIQLDLTRPEDIQRAVDLVGPDWIVHAAAEVNVDGCERDPATARRVNAEATGHLAEAAAKAGARMVYVSTDYVFDGDRGNYTENDAPNPVQTYGVTKLDGEREAARHLPNGLAIARTSVLYGPHKPNFVTWLTSELCAGKPVRIAEDQRVSPTLTTDLATQILAIIEQEAEGVFHTAGATAATRLEMAHAIADAFNLPTTTIEPVPLDSVPWTARRPRDSTLNVTRISRIAQPMPLRDQLRTLKKSLEAPGGPAG